jgi:glucosamine--fructose-6-phosphate aminotransferase (isomerizing)
MTTLMEREATEASARIAEQLQQNQHRVQELSHTLKKINPRFFQLVGRGSSDHAGVFAKYLLEIETGIPVVHAAPSIATVYKRRLQLHDIVTQAEMAKASGAYVVALVNDTESPLAQTANFVLPLAVGPEKAVAATKSYLATLSALLQLTAHFSDNSALQKALSELPQQLAAACAAPAQLHASDLHDVDHLVVLARGLGFAIAKEMALKMKEVCGIQAEAFSSAEFLHGPVALAHKKLTVIDAQIRDEALLAHQQKIADVSARGARVLSLHQSPHDAHPRIAPLLVLQRFYLDIAHIAVARGHNPDQPIGLNKVTETL